MGITHRLLSPWQALIQDYRILCGRYITVPNCCRKARGPTYRQLTQADVGWKPQASEVEVFTNVAFGFSASILNWKWAIVISDQAKWGAVLNSSPKVHAGKKCQFLLLCFFDFVCPYQEDGWWPFWLGQAGNSLPINTLKECRIYLANFYRTFRFQIHGLKSFAV